MNSEDLRQAHEAIQQIKAGALPRPLEQIPNVKPHFNQAKTSKIPIEKKPSVEELRQARREREWGATSKYSDPDYFKDSKLGDIENIYPKFQEAALGKEKISDSEERMSDMVATDSNTKDLKPSKEIAQPVDKEQFDKAWEAEKDKAKEHANDQKLKQLAERVEMLESQMDHSLIHSKGLSR